MEYAAMLIDADLGNDRFVIRDFVQALEGAGFDALLTNDHVVGGHPDRQRPGETVHSYDVPCHEPLTFLSFVAGATDRIGLGTAIVIAPQRQTVLLAKQCAELDVLSGGRVRLGVGVGRNWMEYEALGEDFATRGRRLEEQVAVMRALWIEELVTFDGEWHHLDRIGINPLPIQRPIPVWMGSFVGALAERVLERVGRLADGWIPQYPPGAELAAAIDRLRRYAVAAGREPTSISIECGVRIRRDDDPQRWIESADAYAALGATHLRVTTLGGGFTSPSEHLAAMCQWLDVVRHRP